MKKTVLIALCLLILGGAYWFVSGRQRAAYAAFESASYTVELPSGWDLHEDGSQLFAFPTIDGSGSDVDIDEVYRSNRRGMTIMTSTIESRQKLDDFYSRFYEHFTPAEFTNTSPDILEVRVSNLDAASGDEPAAGYTGSVYAIKTNKRVYSVSVFHKDASFRAAENELISRVVSTLRDK